MDFDLITKSMKKCSKCYEKIPRIWYGWVMLIAVTAFEMVKGSNRPLCKKNLELTETLEMIQNTRDFNGKQTKLLNFLEKLSELEVTHERLLMKADALEQLYQLRHGKV